MDIAKSIFQLETQHFYISKFAIVKKEVIPPAHFVCSHNLVLNDRFFYVVRGTIVFDDEAHNNLRFSAGDILYLPANTTYRSYWDEAEHGTFISLNFVLTGADEKPIHFADDITLCCHDKSGKMLQSFTETYRTWEKASQGYKLDCMSRLIRVMRQIAVRSERQSVDGDSQNILEAVYYLEENYLQNVTVEELSKLAYLQECQFRRRFKRLKGMSPVKYRNLLRLRKAAEILQSGEYSVVEAAMMVGFDDPNYFSRLFKTHYGESPTRYIAKEGEKNDDPFPL